MKATAKAFAASAYALGAGLALAVSLVGCKSAPLGSSTPTPEKITIKFKGRAGDVSETRYHSSSRAKQFQETQIVRDKSEEVDFVVKTKTTSVDGDLIRTTVETTKKDGIVNLHDLAFPELNESIDFVTRTDGNVLHAGHYPPQSLFFLPTVPVPDHPVAIGDTWTMERGWLSAREGLPLKLSVVGILKAIVPCERSICADIEVSGSVGVTVPPNVPGARFSSHVWGRLLFSLERGDVLWSEMRGDDEMVARSQRSATISCMISEMKTAKAFKGAATCDPSPRPVDQVPKF